MLSKKVLFSFIPLVLVILIAVFFRFIWLDKVPNAIGGDEIVYVLNAKASFLTGRDIFGTWSPIKGLLFQYPTGETQAELPYILDSFSVGPLPLSLFSAHLPNAILGILLVIFIFLVTKQLLGQKIALWAAVVAAINPWLIYIGRTAYEAVPAMLFYFISFYIMLKAKGWQVLIAFPFLALAFYSYIATKLIFIPFVFVILVYLYFNGNKKYLKQYLVLFGLCLIFVIFYFASLKLNPSTARLGEILTPNSVGISNQVNEIRKDSIVNPLSNILTNKYTVLGNIIATKTLKTFSFDFLFVNGDEFFSIYRHGLFYYIDSLFIVLGTIFIFIKRRSIFFLLSSLILIGIVPQVFHTADIGNFSVHATMAFVFLIILIAVGIEGLIEMVGKKKLRLAVSGLIVLLYFVSAVNFFNIYFYWFPLQGYFDFPIRIVSNVAFRSSQNQKVTVYSNSSFDYFKKYLFYTDQYNKKTAPIIERNLKNKNYSFGSVTFSSCDLPVNYKDNNNLIIMDVNCGPEIINLPRHSISRLKDGGESFKIYNDKICKGVGLGRYAQSLTLSDFNIEHLSNADFCHDFITSL